MNPCIEDPDTREEARGIGTPHAQKPGRPRIQCRQCRHTNTYHGRHLPHRGQ